MYQKEQPVIRILLFFVEIAPKLEKVGPTFSSFSPFSSLPFGAAKRQETDSTP